MAWSDTLATPAIADTTNASSYATASFTPNANKLMLVFGGYVVGSGTAVAPTPTGAGLGITWSLVTSIISGTTQGCSAWVGYSGASPGTGALTLGFAGVTQNGCCIHVHEIDGADVSIPLATLVSLIQVQTSSTGGTGTGSITLGSAPASTSRCFLGVYMGANENITPRASWTEMADAGHASPASRLESQWRSDASEQTGSATWTSNVFARVIMLEIPGSGRVKSITGAGAIATAEAFGTGQLDHKLSGAGAIATAEAVSTGDKVNHGLTPTGIASAEAFGVAKVNHGLSSAGGIATAAAFGTPTVQLKLVPVGIASGEVFGTAKLNHILTAVGIASGEALGTPAVQLILQAVGIASVEAFGTPAVSLATVIAVSSIPSAEAFGTPAVVLVVDATGIPSEEDFGDFLVVQNFTINDAGDIATQEAFGTITMYQFFDIRPPGIPSQESFGAFSVVKPFIVAVVAVNSQTFTVTSASLGTATLIFDAATSGNLLTDAPTKGQLLVGEHTSSAALNRSDASGVLVSV
jgi:hypothetical protein